MYKIKQKFTIEYELDLAEISREEFEELGFIHNSKLVNLIDSNLKEVKGDIIKSYKHCDNQEVTFNLLQSSLEINDGNITSFITRQLK